MGRDKTVRKATRRPRVGGKSVSFQETTTTKSIYCTTTFKLNYMGIVKNTCPG